MGRRSVVGLLIVMMALAGCVAPSEDLADAPSSEMGEDAGYFSPDATARRQPMTTGGQDDATLEQDEQDAASAPEPMPSAEPSPTTTPTASPTPTATSEPTPSPTSSPTATPTPTSSATASPTPTQTADRLIQIGVAVKGAYADYDPDPVTVPVGSRVAWKNLDSVRHTATNDSAFDTGVIMEGEASEPILFDQPGTYTYYCRVHYDTMRGATIIVDG